MKPPLIIAHRGDSANRPENTLAAFAGALEVGASIVELDVQLTADREVVVLHDPSVDRTTGGSGEVRQMRLAELRALSAGYPARFRSRWAGERIPLLVETLTLLKGRARVLIEVKTESVSDQDRGGIEDRTVDVVRSLGMTDAAAIISFDARALRRLRALAPEIMRGRLFGRTSAEEVVRTARESDCGLVMPHKGQLSEELAQRVHEAGIQLATWVVDTPDELKRIARFGLYGVGSNDPGALIQAIANGLLDEPGTA